jgi:hypothetical protein
MKKQMLKIAGVKSEREFYKKFPTEEAFMAKHGKAFKKAQIGAYIGGEQDTGFQPVSFQDIYNEADYAVTGMTDEMRKEEELRQAQIKAAQKESGGGGGGLGNVANILQSEELMSALGGARKGKKIKKAQVGTNQGSQLGVTQQTLQQQQYNWGTSNPAINFQSPGIDDPGIEIEEKQGDALKQISKYAGPAGQLIQGFQQLRDEKRALERAEQMRDVSGLVRQAASTRPEQTQRRYVRPEDMMTTGEELFPIYGVGTNVLARDGKMVGGIPGEITNTFAPNTLYDDLAYEPLNDSERYKQFMYGGKMYKAQTGLEMFAQAGGGDITSQMITGITGENAGGNIGGTIGKLAGTAIGGPVGGMIGQVGGQLIGSAINRKPQKIKRAKAATQQNIQATALGQGFQGGQAQYSSFMEDGGKTSPYAWMSHTWQPQVITTFGEHKLKDLLTPPKDADMLRAGGHLKEYTPPSAQAMFTGRPNFQMGGELQTHWGGYAEPMSQNPYLPEGGETIMFRGQSHDESDGRGNTGIGITYGQNPVEVERGEPAMKMKDGSSGDNSLVVFGNLKIPNSYIPFLGEDAKGKKFKTYVADLSKKENKINKRVANATNELDELDVQTPFDKLKFNSLDLTINGGSAKLKEIADKKMSAASLQNAINDTAEEYGLIADDLARGRVKMDKKVAQEQAKYGKAIAKAQAGYKSKYGLEPWTGDKSTGIKNASAYNTKEWDEIAESIGFDKTGKRGNRAFQEFLFENENLKNAIINNHQRLYSSDPTSTTRNWFDDKLGAGWAAPELKPKAPVTPAEKPSLSTSELKQPTDKGAAAARTTQYATTPYKRSGIVDVLGQALPYLRPSDMEQLDERQLSGEMYALATNQLEPVAAQTIQPQLSVPYDISLQDILNENEATFRSQQRMVGYNPAAQSQLNAQKYAANQRVLGEQFRLNQAMKNQVYKENRDLLNQFGLKNLEILDRQYVRQAEAKSKTKATTQAALNSIGDKYLRNQLENRTLATYENLYNYRYDPRFRAMNMNAPFQPTIPTVYGGDLQRVPVLDDKGNILYYEQKVVDPATATAVEVPAPGVRMAAPRGEEVVIELPANATVPAQQSQLGQPNPYTSDAQAAEMGLEPFETPNQLKENFLNPFGKNGLKMGKKKSLNSSIVKAIKNL